VYDGDGGLYGMEESVHFKKALKQNLVTRLQLKYVYGPCFEMLTAMEMYPYSGTMQSITAQTLLVRDLCVSTILILPSVKKRKY
jgi:hypothetical protein